MTPIATIVHQTQGRLRLRIAGKRRDLHFFLALYDHLRQAPCVDEVTMNPVTGSVLLYFDAQRLNTVIGALADSPLIALSSRPAIVSNAGGEPGRIERFLNTRGTSTTDPRTIIFLIMVVLSVRQLMQGQILGPVLTMVLYGVDFAVGLRTQTEQSEPSASP